MRQPVLVVAGAGSGKDAGLTVGSRIWSASAAFIPARSWRSRSRTRRPQRCARGVIDLVGNRAKLMWVSTFHSACVRILRAEIGRFGIARSFSIYDDADAKRLMQLVLRDQERSTRSASRCAPC